MTHEDRIRLHALANDLIAHKDQLDYPRNDVRGPKDAATFKLTGAEARAALAAGKRLMFDCSGAVTCMFKWCELHDPNGLRYAHEGYTGTMLAHLPHYTNPKKARRGALVVFGPATGEHVCMVIEPDPVNGDPLLFSHGFEHETGPVRLSVERSYHHPPVTFLDVSGL